MTTTQTSIKHGTWCAHSGSCGTRQVQPEPILKVGTYQGGSALISKLTLGGQSLYILGNNYPRYFTELKEAVITAYDHAVRERLTYKRSCHGRDVADGAIRDILNWVIDNSHKDYLSGVSKDIVAINNRYGFDHTA